MTIQSLTETELRDKLCRYIEFLNSKSHIECLPTLNRYKVKLDMNERLTGKEMNTLLRFLVRDVDKDIKELKQMFRPIVRTKKQTRIKEETPSTLDAFLP